MHTYVRIFYVNCFKVNFDYITTGYEKSGDFISVVIDPETDHSFKQTYMLENI